MDLSNLPGSDNIEDRRVDPRGGRNALQWGALVTKNSFLDFWHNQEFYGKTFNERSNDILETLGISKKEPGVWGNTAKIDYSNLETQLQSEGFKPVQTEHGPGWQKLDDDMYLQARFNESGEAAQLTQSVNSMGNEYAGETVGGYGEIPGDSGGVW